MKLLCFLSCWFITAFTPVLAQHEDILLQFNTVQIENSVQLNFTIKAGNTCNGIQIYRSPDSINFSEIGDIQGVCGSTDRDESYSFTDNSPVKNANNYYRLQLGMLGNTYITGLFFIELTGNSALIFPNPVTGESSINFLNTSHEELKLTVFSCDRKLYYVSPASRGNSFLIGSRDFKSGIYFYEVIGSDGFKLKGKFIVE